MFTRELTLTILRKFMSEFRVTNLKRDPRHNCLSFAHVIFSNTPQLQINFLWTCPHIQVCPSIFSSFKAMELTE